MKELKRLQEDIQNLKSKRYYIVECPFCHSILAVEHYEFEHLLFEPIEKEFESYKFEHVDGKVKMIPFEEKTMVSSDPSKDLYKLKLCCNCGYRPITLTNEEFKALKTVEWDGTNNIYFELDETESANARAFIQEHKDCCEKHLDKKMFSSNGGQFEYTICPTGLGNLVNIKCNTCNESKDITNIDNW